MLKGSTWDLAYLVAEVGAELDDAGHGQWSSASKERAIRSAVRAAAGEWWEIRIDDTHTYSHTTHRYALPVGCVRILEVWFEPFSTTKPRRFVSPTSWRVEGDYLVFIKPIVRYTNRTMYITYRIEPSNLLDIDTNDGVIASSTATALTSAGATFSTKGVRMGDAVVINETGYAGNGTYYVVSIDSETQLTLHKAPGTAGATLDYNVAHLTDLPYKYLIYYAMSELYEVAARNRPGVQEDEYLRWASYYKQLAAMELKKKQRHHKGRRTY